MYGFGMPEFLVVAIIGLGIFPFWKIFSKAGFSPWLSLTILVPLLNIGVLYYLAFAEWPIHRKTNGSADDMPTL